MQRRRDETRPMKIVFSWFFFRFCWVNYFNWKFYNTILLVLPIIELELLWIKINKTILSLLRINCFPLDWKFKTVSNAVKQDLPLILLFIITAVKSIEWSRSAVKNETGEVETTKCLNHHLISPTEFIQLIETENNADELMEGTKAIVVST